MENQLDLLSPAQLEEWLGITKHRQNLMRNIRYYRNQAHPIPFYKIAGMGIRYKRSEIIEWIDKQKVVK